MLIILCGLTVLMILGAFVALEAVSLLSSAVLLGIIGFSLSAIFLILQAPDLAIVQIVVETLSLVIFIAAILKTTSEDATVRARARVPFLVIAGAFVVLFMLAVGWALGSMPPFGWPSLRMAGPYLTPEALPRTTGAANFVTAVVLDFRGYDTLGEATVLFTAVMGVLAVLRTIGRKH
jgi:multisubunit Na+/H+ antiporter MnhB subunit